MGYRAISKAIGWRASRFVWAKQTEKPRAMGKERTSRQHLGRGSLRSQSAALFLAVGLCVTLLNGKPVNAQTDITREIECLALTIYFEARGEPDIGKLAVGHVVKNRAAHPLFPERICEVVQQGGTKAAFHCQFSWWCDGASDEPVDEKSWQRSRALARRVFWDYSEDPTEGALWYHAEYVEPSWGLALERGPHIGRHVFYRLEDHGKGDELDARGAGVGFTPIRFGRRF